MRKQSIPLSVPHITGNEWKYIKECLDTEWVSSAGKFVDRFEKDFCQYVGAKHAVACVNGTAALHIALRIAGVSPGDEVIVPTLTFIAPVNSVRYVGADPVFMDCDDYYNIDTEKTIEFIEKETRFQKGVCINKSSGNRISAIIPVHVFGNAVYLTELQGVCQERGITIIEDATESMGTRYKKDNLVEMHTGTIGDIGCFSFNGNKIITTGGGGMIASNINAVAEKARYLTTQAKDDPIKYVHDDVGYNYRLTNLQAAMGVAQLEKLPEFLQIKVKNYDYYKDALDETPGLHVAEVPGYAKNNHWMYALQVDKDIFGLNRDRLMNCLSKKDIQTRPIWYLNHLQRVYKNCHSYRIEKAYQMLEQTLNIPCSVNLTQTAIDEVIKEIQKTSKQTT